MNLFSDFANNLSTTYRPNDFQQKYPCDTKNSRIERTEPQKPFELVKNGKFIGYFWYQGDSVDLVFDIESILVWEGSDSYMSANDLVKGLEFEATFYDFRGIKILEYFSDTLSERKLEVSTPEGAENAFITLSIDNETSTQIVKGVYKLELIAKHPSGYRQTIFSKEDCVFEIR